MRSTSSKHNNFRTSITLEFRKQNQKRTIEDEWDFRTPKESEEALNSPLYTKRLGMLMINEFLKHY